MSFERDSTTAREVELGTRDRMIVHAADLIGRDGVPGTSIGDVLTASSNKFGKPRKTPAKEMLGTRLWNDRIVLYAHEGAGWSLGQMR